MAFYFNGAVLDSLEHWGNATYLHIFLHKVSFFWKSINNSDTNPKKGFVETFNVHFWDKNIFIWNQ